MSEENNQKILLADGGSTKCDWLLTNKKGEVLGHFSTPGLNPYFLSASDISSILETSEQPAKATEIAQVYFYGAGASDPVKNEVITEGLSGFYSGATVRVNHDILGAAYSTYNGQPGICCILGTGSNTCFFDGQRLRTMLPSLGYVLGDEGSGAYFGKVFLRAFFYGQLAPEVAADFFKSFNMTREELLDRIYRGHQPNAFLASFMPFLHRHRLALKALLTAGFLAFLRTHVMAYPNWHALPVHFIGSVAFYFQEELQECCAELGIQCSRVLQKPIMGLLDYHKVYLFPDL